MRTRESDREYHRQRRVWSRSMGLCIDCPRPAEPYRSRCSVHLEKRRDNDRVRNAARRAKAVTSNLCPTCLLPLDPYSDPNHKTCINCREYTSRRNRI